MKIDWAGQKFHMLTLIKKSGRKRGTHTLWEALCECGNITYVEPSLAKNGHVKSCGCFQPQGKNWAGEKHYRLTIIMPMKDPTSEKYQDINTWLCECDCGNKICVPPHQVALGNIRSCGCLNQEQRSKNGAQTRKYTPIESSARYAWHHYSDGCSFELFIELSQQDCFYCGIAPFRMVNAALKKDGSPRKQKRGILQINEGNFIFNGLDRIDSNQDHSPNNIVPCCYPCNKAKSNMTLQDFLIWIEMVYNHTISIRNTKIFTTYSCKNMIDINTNIAKLGNAKSAWRSYKDGCDFASFLILSQEECFYCGCAPYKMCNSSNKNPNSLFIYNGLDRIDSSMDHYLNNVVPCCHVCNFAKNDRSFYDFLSWIEMVYYHTKTIRSDMMIANLKREYLPASEITRREKISVALKGRTHSMKEVERKGVAKLTYDIADQIRAEFAAGKYKNKKELGNKYGVGYRAIYNIIANKTWIRR